MERGEIEKRLRKQTRKMKVYEIEKWSLVVMSGMHDLKRVTVRKSVRALGLKILKKMCRCNTASTRIR